MGSPFGGILVQIDELSAGLTAHVGEVDAQHGVVHLKAIGSVVPANTAVIITGEPGTYTLTATTEAPQSFAKNDLKEPPRISLRAQ